MGVGFGGLIIELKVLSCDLVFMFVLIGVMLLVMVELIRFRILVVRILFFLFLV